MLSKKYTCDLRIAISDAIRSNKLLDSCMIENKKQDKAFVIIDETGWNENVVVNITLSLEGIKTVDDLRNVLKPYDLDIMKAKREIEFIVFKRVEQTQTRK